MGTLELIALLLIIFWGFGAFFHVAGMFIHLLLIIAVVMILLRIIRGGARSV